MKSKKKKPVEREIEIEDGLDLEKECENIEKENHEKWKKRRFEERTKKKQELKEDCEKRKEIEKSRNEKKEACQLRKAEMKKKKHVKEIDENERKRKEI